LPKLAGGPRPPLFSTGETFYADHAHHIGLVHDVVCPKILIGGGATTEGVLSAGPAAVASAKPWPSNLRFRCPLPRCCSRDAGGDGPKKGFPHSWIAKADIPRYARAVMIAEAVGGEPGRDRVRVIRAAKEMGIRTVAVFSDADRDALHVALADEAIGIGASNPRRATSTWTGSSRRPGIPARMRFIRVTAS